MNDSIHIKITAIFEHCVYSILIFYKELGFFLDFRVLVFFLFQNRDSSSLYSCLIYNAQKKFWFHIIHLHLKKNIINTPSSLYFQIESLGSLIFP